MYTKKCIEIVPRIDNMARYLQYGSCSNLFIYLFCTSKGLVEVSIAGWI